MLIREIIILAKRLSENQKQEIIMNFRDGISIDELAREFNCTKLTISRNLKKNIEEEEYRYLMIKNSSKSNNLSKDKQKISDFQINNELKEKFNGEIFNQNKSLNLEKDETRDLEFPLFTEIIPLNEEIENSSQKDLSSIPISDITFPNIVYMVVDKRIELEIKILKDYPEWQFLSENELERKTIEIFEDLKTARRFCGKEQKVIKVPNTKVFEIVAPILVSRGISRIISNKKLIAL